MAGELERLEEFWFSGGCKSHADGQTSMELGVLNFTSAFYMLGIGVLGALIIVLGEHIYFCFGRKRLGTLNTNDCCGLVSMVCLS
jgi:hypothetical protein